MYSGPCMILNVQCHKILLFLIKKNYTCPPYEQAKNEQFAQKTDERISNPESTTMRTLCQHIKRLRCHTGNYFTQEKVKN